ncbi:MAG: hypothetical protein ABIP89_21460 [Polyangiaceae bacterium]
MVIASASFFFAACDKKEPEAAPAPSASALTASVASVKSVKFTVDPKGKMTIDMPAPKEHIKAETTVSGGSLDVDLANLANTRGEVKVDVTSLKTTTFDDSTKNESQTEHALTWLEVSDKATPAMREQDRWVVYAIRSIDGLSAPDITKVAPTKAGTDDVRTVTLTAHGEFLLHGHKIPKDAALEVAFHYPAGAAADSKPARIDIKTKTPLHINLAEHEVKPRDTFGKVAQGSFSLLGTKVADVADVSFELRSIPQ